MRSEASFGDGKGPTVLAGGPLLIAHRGGAGLAPENTMAAFRQAVDRWPVDMMELDVHATADGHCVVIHDPTVDRTTNGQGVVAALSLAELQTLDAGYRFELDGEQPFRDRGVRIPTLDEVLDALPDMRLTIEVKA
ncbi:MAG: glycerophosphodiester phosphodiesterase family protein, partial [Gemmatimonadota bacterium]